MSSFSSSVFSSSCALTLLTAASPSEATRGASECGGCENVGDVARGACVRGAGASGACSLAPPENECENPRNMPAHRMKHKMNVTDHHQTLCCVREGHTPIQFLGMGWPSSSYSSSDDDPSSGARSGCSRWYSKMRSSPTFSALDRRWCLLPEVSSLSRCSSRPRLLSRSRRRLLRPPRPVRSLRSVECEDFDAGLA